MVVSARDHRRCSSLPASATPREVIWHDLECGSYRADLPLWQELADRYPGPILDVGAGTGRVALDLARAGRSVTALDLDPVLLAALKQRAAEAKVETVCADARSFELIRRDFGLCVVPMQTIQLLGGSAERVAFLRAARVHLRRGGLLACAILSALEPFDCADGDVGPTPETARVEETLYLSRPTRVGVRGRSVLIERERRILAADDRAGGGAPGERRAGEPAAERHVIELDRLSAAELEREAIEAGLRPEPAREVAPTDDHVGSDVVMLRA
jgi:SAM-dependent methyltransferase